MKEERMSEVCIAQVLLENPAILFNHLQLSRRYSGVCMMPQLQISYSFLCCIKRALALTIPCT
jgi:hypothetical protein